MSQSWLAVLQGNTHHRWGWFRQGELWQVQVFPAKASPTLPQGMEIWRARTGSSILDGKECSARDLTLAQIPLQATYPSLGIDRALALVAASNRYGWPVLVIDAGTALTLSAGEQGLFVGGAILPGLGVQARSLHQGTAALPEIAFSSTDGFPTRWANNTQDAIRSGILHTVLAGIRDYWQDWRRQFPNSAVVLTGGDGDVLYPRLQIPNLVLAPNLVLQGIADCRSYLLQ